MDSRAGQGAPNGAWDEADGMSRRPVGSGRDLQGAEDELPLAQEADQYRRALRNLAPDGLVVLDAGDAGVAELDDHVTGAQAGIVGGGSRRHGVDHHPAPDAEAGAG